MITKPKEVYMTAIQKSFQYENLFLERLVTGKGKQIGYRITRPDDHSFSGELGRVSTGKQARIWLKGWKAAQHEINGTIPQFFGIE